MLMTCYGYSSPDVVVLPNYGPCNPRAGIISLCCELGDTCLTNGLCVTPSGVYYNGGCTDDTYQSAICPKYCTSGDANWVIQCPSDSAVITGDFCCSVNGTTSTCCNTPGNGLGLVAAKSSAEAVSTSNGANTVPAYISSGATTPSSKSIASHTMSTSPPRPILMIDYAITKHSSDRSGISIVTLVAVIGCLAFFPTIWRLWVFAKWIKRRCGSRRTERNISLHRNRRAEADNYIAMDNLRDRRDESECPEPSSRGVTPNEVEGSQAGPLEMDASQTHLPAAGPPSAGPSSIIPTSPGPSSAGSSSAGPSSTRPTSAGPSSAGSSSAGPSAGPFSTRASSAGPSTSRALDGNPLAEPRARAWSFV